MSPFAPSRNEHTYGQQPASGTLAMTKLKNALLRIDPTLVVALKNIRVNGLLMGCSGFVTSPATGKIVYVNTDNNHGSSLDNALYRNARHAKDYTGGRNHFSTYAELPEAIVELLNREGDQA